MNSQKRIENALNIAAQYGGIDGEHHKDWVIDQMVRALTGCPMVEKNTVDYRGKPYTFEAQGESKQYLEFVADVSRGEDGPNTYEWSTGIAP